MSHGGDNKTLHNTTGSQAKDNVPDLEIFGDADTFTLICKASSKQEGWMKSTKAMEIKGVGCIVQVTTQQGDHVAEALVFVPGVRISGLDRSDGFRELIRDRYGRWLDGAGTDET